MVNEEREKKYLSLLHQEIAMALGCTEPAAAALTGAYAADILKETVEAATIKECWNSGDRNVWIAYCFCFRNCFSST